MRITICAVGRLKNGPLLDLVQDYTKRLQWDLILKEIDIKSGLSGETLKNEEGQRLLKATAPKSCIFALDERGRSLSSLKFADELERTQSTHNGQISFLIGGAEGLSSEVKTKAHTTISFGQQTWPHMLARVMLCEQIYRAQQILKGHPYHKE